MNKRPEIIRRGVGIFEQRKSQTLDARSCGESLYVNRCTHLRSREDARVISHAVLLARRYSICRDAQTYKSLYAQWRQILC